MKTVAEIIGWWRGGGVEFYKKRSHMSNNWDFCGLLSELLDLFLGSFFSLIGLVAGLKICLIRTSQSKTYPSTPSIPTRGGTDHVKHELLLYTF